MAELINIPVQEIEAGENALATLSDLLPGVESTDYYRITLTGYSAPLDLDELRQHFEHIPNLILRDETVPEMDLWQNIGEDSLEGLLFAQLKAGTESESETASRRAALAARICRRILDGQEVKLP